MPIEVAIVEDFSASTIPSTPQQKVEVAPEKAKASPPKDSSAETIPLRSSEHKEVERSSNAAESNGAKLSPDQPPEGIDEQDWNDPHK